jgi:hypothetical protein
MDLASTGVGWFNKQIGSRSPAIDSSTAQAARQAKFNSRLRSFIDERFWIVCGYRDHRNRSPTADGQAADVNVGYGASISDRAMSATSLKRTSVMQRELPIASGRFLEAKVQSIYDLSAAVHNGQHRAHSAHFESQSTWASKAPDSLLTLQTNLRSRVDSQIRR